MSANRSPQAVLVTDKGLRERNEDYVGYAVPTDEKHRDQGALFVLADGMGGHQAGDVASKTAVETVKKAYLADSNSLPVCDRLVDAVEKANDHVYRLAGQRDSRSGMGTTTVAAVLQGRKVAIAHVGDSRAYVLHRATATLEQVTKDHSLVQEMVDRGELDPEDAEYHPQRKVVTRSLGRHESVAIDAKEISLEPGDIVLLCSDGLTRPVSERSIADALSRQPLDRAALDLTRLAIVEGHDDPDNVSVVLFEVPHSAAEPLPAPKVIKSPSAPPAFGRYLVAVGAAMTALLLMAVVGPLVGWGANSHSPSGPSIAQASTESDPTAEPTNPSMLASIELVAPSDRTRFDWPVDSGHIVLKWSDPSGSLGRDEGYVIMILLPNGRLFKETVRGSEYPLSDTFYYAATQSGDKGLFRWRVFRAKLDGGAQLSNYGSWSSFEWLAATDTPAPVSTSIMAATTPVIHATNVVTAPTAGPATAAPTTHPATSGPSVSATPPSAGKSSNNTPTSHPTQVREPTPNTVHPPTRTPTRALSGEPTNPGGRAVPPSTPGADPTNNLPGPTGVANMPGSEPTKTGPAPTSTTTRPVPSPTVNTPTPGSGLRPTKTPTPVPPTATPQPAATETPVPPTKTPLPTQTPAPTNTPTAPPPATSTVRVPASTNTPVPPADTQVVPSPTHGNLTPVPPTEPPEPTRAPRSTYTPKP